MESPLFEREPVLAVCGWGGSGKTTVLEKVIPLLVDRGLRVAVVKHDAHGIQVDREGKDSARLFAAGADIHLRGPDEHMWRMRPPPEDRLDRTIVFLLSTHDVVLVEGHKEAPLPKVWCHTPEGMSVPEGLTGILASLSWGDDRVASVVSIIEGKVKAALESRSIYGGVLVGGRSTRMGSPKQCLRVGGRSLLSTVATALRSRAERVVVLGHGDIPEDSGAVDQLVDAPGSGQGPVAGLLTALRWTPGVCWVIGACDMPGINGEAVEWLIEQRQPGCWAIIPRDADGRLEPTLALYEPQAKSLIESLVLRGERAPRGLDQWSEVHTPPIPDRLIRAWANVNTPGELRAFEEIHNGRQSGGPTSGPPRSSSR